MSASIENGILVISGTSGDDRINIDQELGGVCVEHFTLTEREGYKDAELTFEILNPIMGLRGVRVDGGDGNDSIVVSEGAAHDRFALPVTLIGGEGDDSLQGGSGDDVLIGGPGDNLLDGRGGNNSLDGPASPLASTRYDRSSKTLFVTGTRKDDVIEFIYDGSTSYDQHRIFVNGEAFWSPDLVGIKRVVIEGLGGNDTIHVDAGDLPATVYGGAGDDSIFGGARADSLIGGSGRDMIFADMSTTHFPVYWQYLPPDYGCDPEQFIERTDGINRFNDGTGNDVLEGEGPDQYVPPAPVPAPAPPPAPAPAPLPSENTSSDASSSETADDAASVEVQGPAPKQAMVSSPFSINPVLATDKKLWDL